MQSGGRLCDEISGSYESVSYTHLEVYKRQILNEAREYTDTAIITICRFSGEGWDRKCEAAQDGYVLDGEEKRNSELSAKIFENGDFCLTNAENIMVAVSYTHLDVYKRQLYNRL